MAIACVYCGGAHDGAADVRACWQRQQSGGLADRDTPAAESSGPLRRRRSPLPVMFSIPRAAGPDELGRHLVVADRELRDSARRGTTAPVVRVDEHSLADPEPLLAVLRAAAFERQRLVIEYAAAGTAFPSRRDERPLLRAGRRDSRSPLDELDHLVFANAIDARDAAGARWALLDRALALGARPALDSDGDVVLADGTSVWLDGGPISFHGPIGGLGVVPALAVEHGSLRPPRRNSCDADLAPDQLDAVAHPGGAARIIAPAGSGKTRVLTERARHLLTNWELPTTAVSLVAFNKRAQGEMVERTTDLPGLQVRTLNAIALAIVNGTPPFARTAHQMAHDRRARGSSDPRTARAVPPQAQRRPDRPLDRGAQRGASRLAPSDARRGRLRR